MAATGVARHRWPSFPGVRQDLFRRKWEPSWRADSLSFQDSEIPHSSVLNCLAGILVETTGDSLALMVQQQVLQATQRNFPMTCASKT